MRGIRSSSTRRIAALAVTGALVFSLAACANDPLADQYRQGDNKGFIAGDGAVQEIPEDQRGEPVEFAATTENGDPVSSADFAGDVLVVNFWYAACGPCRAEAKDLEAVYQWNRAMIGDSDDVDKAKVKEKIANGLPPVEKDAENTAKKEVAPQPPAPPAPAPAATPDKKS